MRRFKRPQVDRDTKFDYKNPQFLKAFLTERGRILPRRLTKLGRSQQRELTLAIKRSRTMALLPYTAAQQYSL